MQLVRGLKVGTENILGQKALQAEEYQHSHEKLMQHFPIPLGYIAKYKHYFISKDHNV